MPRATPSCLHSFSRDHWALLGKQKEWVMFSNLAMRINATYVRRQEKFYGSNIRTFWGRLFTILIQVLRVDGFAVGIVFALIIMLSGGGEPSRPIAKGSRITGAFYYQSIFSRLTLHASPLSNSGRLNVKLLPAPNSLWTQMSPLWASMIFLAIAKPRPAPLAIVLSSGPR